MIEGELLDGDNKYRCSQCNKKVAAIRRDCIARAPPYMVMHLKRFEFNYSTMANSDKLNDKFAFPPFIDIAPYTRQHLLKSAGATTSDSTPSDGISSLGSSTSDAGNTGQSTSSTSSSSSSSSTSSSSSSASSSSAPTPSSSANEMMLYRLAAIVVHTGRADGGHYYTYVRKSNLPGTHREVARLKAGTSLTLFHLSLIITFNILSIFHHISLLFIHLSSPFHALFLSLPPPLA